MRLDDGEAQATLDQAKAAVDAASAQVRQVRTVNVKDAREAVTRAQTRLDEAQRTHADPAALHRGAVPRETLEDAGTSLSLAESELRAAQNQEADVAGPARELQRGQTSGRGGARRGRGPLLLSAIDLALRGRGDRAIGRAGRRGPGRHAGLRRGPPGSDRADRRARRTKPRAARGGAAGDASSEAFPADRFAAKVTYIAPVVDPRRGTIEVRLSVPEPPEYLRPDMTVSVEITVAERAADTTILPADAVRGLAADQAVDPRWSRTPTRSGATSRSA
jgi:HlyD family secretion protein